MPRALVLVLLCGCGPASSPTGPDPSDPSSSTTTSEPSATETVTGTDTTPSTGTDSSTRTDTTGTDSTGTDTTGTDPSTGTTGTSTGTTTDTTGTTPAGLLANGGFESGASWWRPSGYTHHEWATTGDPIYESPGTFTAFEGRHALKLWGFYSGSVPNDSEHGLDLEGITPGDTHSVVAQVYQHPDDAMAGGNAAVLFLRFLDDSGAVLAEVTSGDVDGSTSAGVWHERSVVAEAPAGATRGQLGVRYHLSDWSDTGAVYVDDVRWTSTGTGAVSGERLLVWNDEFGGSELDETKWSRLVLPAFTYNSELQAYTASTDNADVRDGRLVITAREEADGSITSARLVTDGKGDWTYGRVEAMAQVPTTVGTWPAFWMLPSDWSYGGWPDSGEIDIMEHVGCDLDHVHQTVHTGAYNHLLGTQQGGSTYRNATAAMHLYAVEWTAEELVFTVDGENIFTFENDGLGDSDTWPFDQRFHIILNLAFGGDWGGWCGVDRPGLPTEYVVDWLRVYQ